MLSTDIVPQRPLIDPENYRWNSLGGDGTMREPDLGGWPEKLCITVHHSLCLSVVHDMIKWITGPVVCGELWHDEPF